MSNGAIVPSENFKGASRGFHGFLTQTILKLVVANLIHSKHYL